jgi:hypothetical protein
VLEKLRERVISYLNQNRVCVIATSGSFGAWAAPAQYENQGLELHCRLPRWSDVIFHIEQEPSVMAIVMHTQPTLYCWLQYRGAAYITDAIDDRYVVVHIAPEHIDLIDESRGYGARETLDV